MGSTPTSSAPNMENQTGFIHLILIIIIAIAVVGAGGFFLVSQISPNTVVNPNPTPTACTQEAKQCPDGSYVSRTGPNCEFAECPIQNPTPTPTPTPIPKEGQIILREGERNGPLLVQKIYTTYITGLNFREYPVAIDQGQPITLRVGEIASNGCTIFLELLRIEGKTAIFNQLYSKQPCPICLAENTSIDTPNGQIAVQDLKKGMEVWTVDEFGFRVAGTIRETSKTPVPTTHQMMHIVLDDSREVFASPGHPIGDGRVFNDLSTGGMLNGSKIIIAEKITYTNGYTYDVLPAGKTGFYFANGILIGSTLK